MTHKRDYQNTKSQSELEIEQLKWRLEKTEEARDYWQQEAEYWQHAHDNKEAQRSELVEALENLYEVQNDAPLEKYRQEWETAMEEAKEVLKKYREGDE